MIDPDKFGYYTVGKFKTYSKYEAYSIGTPTWHFNENVFDIINWKIEPNIDLDTLYKLRAEQIRNQYDYIVLFYSGGSDSNNILRTFIDNNILIDEIASIVEYDVSKDKKTYNNSEIYNQVLKDIVEIKNFTKFRIIEIGKYALEILKDKNFQYNLNVNYSFSPVQVARQILREKITEWKNIIDSGKKLAFIWGKEKPFLNYEQGKLYCVFRDSLDDCVGPYVQKNTNKGWYDELFYWTPDMPLLVVKMAHILKNFINFCDDVSFYKETPSIFGYNSKIKKWISDDTAKKVLYSKWNNNRFDIGKPTNYIFSERDKWLWDSESLESVILNKNISNYLKTIDIQKPKKDIRKLAPCYSKKYWIE